ncbi:MAG: hypothetical protein WC284_16480 [Candidimonas sp.]
MKILNRKEFMKLPAGVLYLTTDSAGKSPEIMIKGATIYDNLGNPIDWATCSPLMVGYDIDPDLYQQSGQSVWVDVECYGRDGLFDDTIFYFVLEKYDLEQLENVILRAKLIS